MKIGVKLIIAFLAVAAVGGIIGYVGFIGTSEIFEKYEQISQKDSPKLLALGQIEASINRIGTEAVETAYFASFSVEKEQEEEMEEAKKELKFWVEEFSKVAESEEEKEFVRIIKENELAYYAAALRIADAAKIGVDSDEFLNLVNDLEDKEDYFHVEISNAIEHVTNELHKQERIAEQLADDTTFLVLIVSMVGVSFAIILGILISHSIKKPLANLQKATVEVAQGNFDIKIDTKASDEIGDLAKTFAHMSESLHKSIELEKKLAVTQEKLKTDRMTTIGSLASSMAHDFTNPLAAIKNSANLIKGSSAENQVIHREIDRINRSISRMKHQVDEVLNFVRTTPLKVQTESVLGMLNSSIDSMEIPKNIEIKLPENDISIDCDKTKLEIAFINIILNAVQAIEPDDGIITIRIIDELEHVKIEFENTGTIIPEDVMPKIFEPLFTTRQKGTGLGLSSCQNIVEQHKGTVSVKSNPVIFTIKIPKK